MTLDDVEAAMRVQRAASQAADVEAGRPIREPEPERAKRFKAAVRRFVAEDGPGCWLAEWDGRAVGMAVAIRRGDLWGLSLLFVHPDHQSQGVGRALIERTLDYAEGAPHGIIMSSPDPKALRRYALAGFDLHPGFGATGTPDRSLLPAAIPGRIGSETDLDLVEAVDARLRPGSARTADAAFVLSVGARLIVVDQGDRRGFAVLGERGPMMLGATDTDTARDLLLRSFAEHPEDEEWQHFGMTAAQNWAVRPLLGARLKLVTDVAMFTRGIDHYPGPYLPSGIYF